MISLYSVLLLVSLYIPGKSDQEAWEVHVPMFGIAFPLSFFSLNESGTSEYTFSSWKYLLLV